jgi:hypothetical protein
VKEYVTDTIEKWVKAIDLVINRIEPKTDPAGVPKKEPAERVVPDMKIFGNVGYIIKLKIVMQRWPVKKPRHRS